VGFAVEYMHVDLADAQHVGDLSNEPPEFDVVHDVDVSLDSITARLNLHLDEPDRVPLK
jgi:hypothetical protein